MSEQKSLFDFPDEPDDPIDLGSMDEFDPFDVEEPEEDIIDIFDSTTSEKNQPPKREPEQNKNSSEKTQTKPPVEEEMEFENPDDNLLEAAINEQGSGSMKNGMGSIFSQPPIFKFSNVEEEITDSKLTFEGLRKEKEADFPEFADSGKVTWNVTYGRINKQVSDPKKKVIYEMKKEIEMSKEFIDSLRKSKDKSPKCIVSPRVYAKPKGQVASSYKGFFTSLEEAQSSDKVICLVPAKDGIVYELRKTDMGDFITPTSNIISFSEIKAGFTPALPLIPYPLIQEIIGLFRHLTYKEDDNSQEALAYIFWDKEIEEFFSYIPHQTVTGVSVDNIVIDEELYDTSRFIHYADIHSHNTMPAKFSVKDDAAERATRIYIVVGRLDRFFPDISVRIANGGKFLKINPNLIIETPFPENFNIEWLNKIKIDTRGVKNHEIFTKTTC